MPHAQAGIAKTRPHTQINHLIQPFAGKLHPQPQVQLAQSSEPLVGTKRRGPVGAAHQAIVVEAGQAQAVELANPVLDGDQDLALGRWGDDVAHEVDGQLSQHAGRPAGGISVDHAVGWIRGVARDPRPAQGLGIGDRQVEVATPQDGRVFRCHGVQIGAAGDMGCRPAGLVPTPAQNPTTGRGLARPFGQPLLEIGPGASLGQLQALQPECPIVEVQMGIV